MNTQGRFRTWDADPSTTGQYLRGLHRSAARRMAIAGVLGGALLTVFFIPPFLSLFAASNETEAQANVAPPISSKSPASLPVLVPRQPIYKGERLVPVMFKLIRVPARSPGALGVSKAALLSGKFAGKDLLPNVPVFEKDLRRTPELNEVVKAIPPDYRAISVSVDATSGVEGWASPGAAVDVVLIAEQNGVATSNVLAQNAEVLSSNRRAASNARPGEQIPTTITLLTRTEEAARIGLASKLGKIVLHLRGWRDSRLGRPEELTLSDLKGARSGSMPTSPLDPSMAAKPSL